MSATFEDMRSDMTCRESVSIMHLLLLLLLLLMMIMLFSGVISASHWESNISYSTTSLSPCYCDV